MEYELNESINKYKINIRSIKFINKRKKYYEKTLKFLQEIKINKIIIDIIDKDFIPVDIIFFYDEEEEIWNFKINKSQFKEKDINNNKKIQNYEKSKKCRLCLNINSFIKKFQNIVKFQELSDADIFEIQKNLNFSKELNNYFDILKEYLKTKENINNNELNLIIKNLEDFIMKKLYDKIYPIEPYEEDNKIFQQTIRLK